MFVFLLKPSTVTLSTFKSLKYALSDKTGAASLVTLIVYVSVVVPSSAVTVISKLFSPTCKFFGPSPITVACSSSGVAVIVIDVLLFDTLSKSYVNVFLLKPATVVLSTFKSLKYALSDNGAASLVTLIVYVSVVVPSCAVTVISKLFSPTCKFFGPSPDTVASLSSGVAVILIAVLSFDTSSNT